MFNNIRSVFTMYSNCKSRHMFYVTYFLTSTYFIHQNLLSGISNRFTIVIYKFPTIHTVCVCQIHTNISQLRYEAVVTCQDLIYLENITKCFYIYYIRKLKQKHKTEKESVPLHVINKTKKLLIILFKYNSY